MEEPKFLKELLYFELFYYCWFRFICRSCNTISCCRRHCSRSRSHFGKLAGICAIRCWNRCWSFTLSCMGTWGRAFITCWKWCAWVNSWLAENSWDRPVPVPIKDKKMINDHIVIFMASPRSSLELVHLPCLDKSAEPIFETYCLFNKNVSNSRFCV